MNNASVIYFVEYGDLLSLLQEKYNRLKDKQRNTVYSFLSIHQ